MRRIGREWRDALRSLRRAPGYAATCAVLLGLGVASTTAILAVGDALLRRPLPVLDGERVVVPFGTQGGDERLSASALEAEAWRRAPSLADLAVALPQGVTLDQDGDPERVRAARVEAGYFPLLGVSPVLGRLFDEAEARAGAPVAVVSHGLWQRRFGGDPSVLGRTLRLDGEDWEVVGVMPAGFDLPIGSEVWRPLHLAAVSAERRARHVYDPVARLAAGRTIGDARTELALIARRLESEYPESNARWGVGVLTLRQNLLDDPRGSVGRAVDLTFWGAAFLLLIACANVGQLQIARAASRRGELGMRLALGASRASLARELAFETLALAGLAALVSVPLSRALAEALLWLAPVSATALSGHLLDLSGSVPLGAAVVAALLTGLLSGAYPALRLARADVATLLPAGGRASVDRRRRALLDGAVLAQVAVTVALSCATVALVESYALLRRIDVGFEPEGVDYYDLSLSPREYADHERRAAFAEALVDGVRGIDGVESAAFTTNVPLASPTVNWIAAYGCEGRELAPGEERYTADRLVGPGYLETLGVRLIAGRTLTARDTENTEPVAVIDASLAEECWPGQDPLGKRVIRLRRSGPLPIRVVGVVADAQEQRVSFGAPHSAWYLPYRQHDFARDLNLVVRGDAPPARIRALVRRLDPHQPLTGPHRLAGHLEEITGSDRMAALVMGYFALLGLLLVGVGIHGSLDRFVRQQHRSIGTRIALGAAPARIVAAVVGRGLALSAVGAALGAASAVALQRLTAAFVHGSLIGLPVRLGLTTAVVLGLAAAAGLAPALRAARIDPALLLRGE